MCEFKNLAASALCNVALVLSSCGTTGSGPAISADLARQLTEDVTSVTGTHVTVGTLTDPCGLALDDPWWIDHGGRVEFHRRCG